jgi:hypothetical protein
MPNRHRCCTERPLYADQLLVISVKIFGVAAEVPQRGQKLLISAVLSRYSAGLVQCPVPKVAGIKREIRAG